MACSDTTSSFAAASAQQMTPRYAGRARRPASHAGRAFRRVRTDRAGRKAKDSGAFRCFRCTAAAHDRAAARNLGINVAGIAVMLDMLDRFRTCSAKTNCCVTGFDETTLEFDWQKQRSSYSLIGFPYRLLIDGGFDGHQSPYPKGSRSPQRGANQSGSLQPSAVDVEHLLAALLDQEGGLATSIFSKAGVNVAASSGGSSRSSSACRRCHRPQARRTDLHYQPFESPAHPGGR